MIGKTILNYFRSRLMTGAGLTAVGTGACIIYQDISRYPKIGQAFSHGHLLPPLVDDSHQTPYFRRPGDERRIKRILEPRFTHEYYLVNGEVGTGKTRIILESVRDLMSSSGAEGHGAPVYVLASQGKSFPDTLAAAVKFSFDEHISFRFFLNYLIGIHSMPGKDETHKLRRVLDAIEDAAYLYMKKTGKPAVLVIDDASYLATHLPGSLQRLQEKAKIWADTNIAKVILVSNDEQTEFQLQTNQSSWSRVDEPIYIGDLRRTEALEFLTATHCGIKHDHHNKNPVTDKHPDGPCIVDQNTASHIVNLVGGRIQVLLQIRRDMHDGIPLDEAIARQKGKEKEKILMVASSTSSLPGLKKLLELKDKNMTLTEFMDTFPKCDLDVLLKQNVLCIRRKGSSMTVTFYSKLTESVLRDWMEAKLL